MNPKTNQLEGGGEGGRGISSMYLSSHRNNSLFFLLNEIFLLISNILNEK